MKGTLFSLSVLSILFFVACGENKVDSPLTKRNGSGQASLTQNGNGTSTLSEQETTVGTSGGSLTLGNLYLNAGGTGISALYVGPSAYGSVGLNINLQSMTPTSDFYKEFYNNKGNNWTYAYVEGRCRPSKTDVCGYAYYAIYIVDYDTLGTYIKIQNFGIVAAATGAVDFFSHPKTNTYLSVDELESSYPVPTN